MKKLDTYQNLCTEVYELSKPNAPYDDYQFYRSYALEAKGPILEPMCGTGRFLLPLIEEGFDVHGFDASQAMLERLFIKTTAKHLKLPKVWHGFMEDLRQANLYRLIFIPSGSFCLLTEIADIQKALKNLYEHLEPGGILVFEIETPHAIPKELGIWRGSQWEKEDGEIILFSQLAILNKDICYSIGKYELINRNDIIQTEIERYKIRIYFDQSFLSHLISEAGFTNIRLLKAFDRQKTFDENDESIVVECRK